MSLHLTTTTLGELGSARTLRDTRKLRSILDVLRMSPTTRAQTLSTLFCTHHVLIYLHGFQVPQAVSGEPLRHHALLSPRPAFRACGGENSVIPGAAKATLGMTL